MMSNLVYAGATSHVGAILRNPDALPERSGKLHRAWDQMAAELRDADLDAVIIVATDHYETFRLEHYPAFCLGLAEEYEGWGEFGNPGGRVAGAAGPAAELLAGLTRRGFDVSRSHEMRLDHSFMVPLVRLGLTDTPVIPLFVNCNTPPLPTLRRCYELGTALGEVVRSMPGGERLAVIGTGGVSHWVGLPRFGDVNIDWDNRFLALMAEGRLEEIFCWTDEQILEEAGNGALEIRTWLVAHAASGGTSGTVLGYQPMPPWAIGIGIMRMEIPA